jgi:phosphonate transport system substrate-binding protein
VKNKIQGVVLALALLMGSPFAAAGEVRSFGVINQRSALLTARYWNPILDYVGRKSGVTLELRMGKTAVETSEMEARGEMDYVFTNHIFQPEEEAAGYKVFARAAGEPIRGQIVVAESSHLRRIGELAGKEVGFPSNTAFVGYAVPMVALSKAGISVKPVFGGNQEGIMAQLRAGTVQAAAVNSKAMQQYAARENFSYRALWTSEDYFDLPIAAHPRLPEAEVARVRNAFLSMAADPIGLAVLKDSAELIKQAPPFGFAAAHDREYRNQRQVYRALRLYEPR